MKVHPEDWDGLERIFAEQGEVAASKGWNNDVDDATKLDGRPFSEKLKEQLLNIHGELSELWEAFRAGTLDEPCDKTGKMSTILNNDKELFGGSGKPLTSLEEEAADIVIRLAHLFSVRGLNLSRAIRLKYEYNKTRPYRHGNKLA